MRGSYAAFGVTNYFEKADGDYEFLQGRNLAEAAKVCEADCIIVELAIKVKLRW